MRAEAYRLAEHVSPQAPDELQQSWRQAGKLPPDDPIELLRAHLSEAVDRGHLQPAVAEGLARDLDAHADIERGRGTRAAGQVDDPRTPVNRSSGTDPGEGTMTTAASRETRAGRTTRAARAATGPTTEDLRRTVHIYAESIRQLTLTNQELRAALHEQASVTELSRKAVHR